MRGETMAGHDVDDPAVRTLIAAINDGDREAFLAALADSRPARPDHR
jgi:hypothetical protein